jgi:hypothetical protein
MVEDVLLHPCLHVVSFSRSQGYPRRRGNYHQLQLGRRALDVPGRALPVRRPKVQGKSGQGEAHRHQRRPHRRPRHQRQVSRKMELG